jgi:drug/metabolite transporter (DMT)-like permease
VLAGVFNGVASLALYRSFELGKMAVVAPLSASYPALTVLLLFFSGERLTAPRASGVALVIAGVICVARGESSASDSAPSASRSESSSPVGQMNPSPESSDHFGAQLSANSAVPARGAHALSNGVGWAILSALGFGVLFWLLGMRVVPAVGFAATVWLIRLTSSVLTAGVILFLRQAIAPPRSAPILGLLFAMGALDTSAFVLNNRGMQLDQISVVSVLASLYGAVTVLLAAAFLRERLTRWQWLGIAAIFTGIATISR